VRPCSTRRPTLARFAFMVSMQLQVIGTANQSGQWLTKGQAAAVINCALQTTATITRLTRSRLRRKSSTRQSSHHAGSGRWMVHHRWLEGWPPHAAPDHHPATIRRVMVCASGSPTLNGPDNEKLYRALVLSMAPQFVCSRRTRASTATSLPQQSTLCATLAKVGRIWQDTMHYASGNCARCNRRLTVPASIGNGYGPKCSELLGL
jgi:hypothetical protein